ncbi:bifunctional 4-hydroxy-2-oxoglutarate aldolase/2-dehydro-3-deoxy-phosphogluconate aldolase [Candidatus Cyanaurora vandensis]|uniref:bifunctional 4-hydroxy-2-oxoglutarate aldolase/2-dehydro-3-deoxy-phosphogluconate aldolase n=1 Tax=Candidatus Cyanaurora vandensis TaxID=2714958 RepID=UPI00257D1334|nr:bifunctional 4-hydroxy-2-oxoglutarate aldolase/2-dehydro-3-deoxy-phosphogluconate aldolase [Candidatus Cyanaurora vandensis]
MHPLLQQWQQDRLVAVIRSSNQTTALEIAARVQAAGVRQLEVTLTFPEALAVMAQLRAGCGTVMTTAQAQAAIAQGTAFLVSPFTHPEIIALGRAAGVLVVSGAWTATEVERAWRLGADVIKLFPAQVGGPDYLHSLKQLFPEVPFFPCGGVTLATATDYLQAGAVAVGIGQGLGTAADLSQVQQLQKV